MKRPTLVLVGIAVLLIITFLVMGFQQKMYPGIVDLPSRVQADLANEKKRFLPENSVDISMAMKLITHEPPNMLNPPGPQAPLLFYPPSEETLQRLSGL
jgi:hypothetical protein